MTFLERINIDYSLNLNERTVPFYDLDLTSDYQLFIDPYRIASEQDELTQLMARKVTDFFTDFLNNIRAGRSHLYVETFKEIQETRFGYSSNSMNGKGIGRKLAERIMNNIITSPAYSSGLLTDLKESTIFVAGVSSDRMSDLITNIVISELIGFTQEICNQYGIILGRTHQLDYFDIASHNRIKSNDGLPMYNGHAFLLVPKNIVSPKHVCLQNALDYYKMGIIPHIQSREDLFTLLIRRQYDQNATKISIDKELRENNTLNYTPGTIDYANEYIQRYDRELESLNIYRQRRAPHNIE
jgi:hypothetical protein